MKFYSVLILVLICNSIVNFQHRNIINKIEFNTLTRGAHQEIIITDDSISIVNRSLTNTTENRLKYKIEKGDWQKLLNALDGISLEQIPSFTSPSNKRAYDGAWHSSIIISTTSHKSFMHSFDNEEPNQKLKPLMLA